MIPPFIASDMVRNLLHMGQCSSFMRHILQLLLCLEECVLVINCTQY